MNSTFDNPQSTLRKSLSSDDIPLLDKQSPPNYITFRSRMAKNSDGVEAINSDFHGDLMNFQRNILGTMNAWFAKQDEKLSVIIKEYEEIKDAVKFVNAKYDDLNKKADDTKNRTSALQNKIGGWDRQMAHVQELQYKVDAMEQSARQCNVEIFNLPEKRSENLVTIVAKISNLIDYPIQPQDLVSAHRVPHADKNSKLPKNVIVKFSSKLFRDNFLAATRKKKGISTSDLEASGSSKPQIIFFNEHLTLKNKLIYKEARDAAKKNGFRYVWSQNGTILVRATDNSPIFAVRSKEEVLKKIKRSST